ncbi:zinc finger protein 263-like [Lampris incognitus]|uniref:zinc finger protein 263-like n=1 Tax=Lampris incognitus TaxID=2546036 RepID=UPI0024B4BA91|nr:zinc finger protein 263-like [Lampris incognitus]
MSKIQMLRALINERLTAAAKEIFDVFGSAIAEYEEELSRSKLEIERQRRLLELSRKPEISLESTAPLQQEWSSAAEDEDPWPPHIKEEPEELWRSRMALRPRGLDEEDVLKFTFFQTTEQNPQQTPLPLSGFPQAEKKTQNLRPQTHTEPDDTGSEAPCNGQPMSSGWPTTGTPPPMGLEAAAEDAYICSVCGKVFSQRGHWSRHMRLHRLGGRTADRSYRCNICGKRLSRMDGFQKHLRVHTGEKPYCCSLCGKRFSDNSNYKRHIRTHTGGNSGNRPARGRGARTEPEHGAACVL